MKTKIMLLLISTFSILTIIACGGEEAEKTNVELGKLGSKEQEFERCLKNTSKENCEKAIREIQATQTKSGLDMMERSYGTQKFEACRNAQQAAALACVSYALESKPKSESEAKALSAKCAQKHMTKANEICEQAKPTQEEQAEHSKKIAEELNKRFNLL